MLLSTLSLELISLFPSVCAVCVVASLWAMQRRLLMQGFIYLTDLLLDGKDYGGSCRGAEGTAVPPVFSPSLLLFNEEE